MSTEYRTLKKVSASDLFDGRLEEFGVQEHVVPDETTKTARRLTDGRNFVWVYIDYEGFVSEFVRWGGNAPGKNSKRGCSCIRSVAVAFDTDVVSEHEPRFWGFDTQKEWDAWMERMSKEHDVFHVELLKFLRGEPNDIGPGTVGMIEAEIAKVLVEKDPSLILPGNREKLRSGIQLIYDRDHAVTVTLSPQDIEFAEMLVTHEDDLPKA